MMRNNVDLPQPEAPTSVTKLCSPTSRSTFSSATVAPGPSPNTFDSPRMETFGTALVAAALTISGTSMGMPCGGQI